MKILVTCFSQTGNTQQVAEAIYKEVSRSDDAQMSNIEDINAEKMGDYDLVFLGTPIHAGGLAQQTKSLLDSIQTNPPFKLAAFITHASSAYEQQGFEQGIRQFADVTKDKNIDYLGYFDCQGRLTPDLHDMVQQMQKVSDEEWAKKMAECDRHPNSEDEENAKAFARELIVKA